MKVLSFFLFLTLFVMSGTVSGRESQSVPKAAPGPNFDIDMQWFISYLNGETGGVGYNKFTLKRGYINIKKKINDTFSGRITPDITVDNTGDVKVRLKYLYLNYNLPSFGIVNKPYFEIGLIHRPWLDFQEHINRYRVQGTMFLERNHILNSADNGVGFFCLLGNEMDEDYRKNVNKHFAGKYGSFALGIYNGGGYHAPENNKNKTLESRVTIRPLYAVIPGLQLSYNGAIGKGNTPESRDWNFNALFVSYERSELVLTGELYKGKGNSGGSAIRDTVSFAAVPQNGYSFFGEWILFNPKYSIIGRYDHFTQDFLPDDLSTNRSIIGLAYRFAPGCKALIDYDMVKYSPEASGDTYVIEAAIEFKY